LALVEVFAYVSFVVILLADANQHRAVGLLGFLGDLIPDTASVHGCLVAIHFVVVDLELLLTGQTAIVLLCKKPVFAGCTLPLRASSISPPSASARSERMLFFREMISEQTACARQSAANAHCTGCTPVIPLYGSILSNSKRDFKRIFEKISSQYSSAMMSTHLSAMLSPAKETV